MTKLSLGIAFTTGLLASSLLFVPANAQALQSRYWLEASAYWPNIDTTVRVTGTRGRVGTDINLESDLNLRDRKGLPAFLAGARIGDRVTIIGEYYALDRSGSAQASRDITFDDVVYPAGVQVDSSFESDVYRLAVGYSFIRRDNLEVGAAIGLHATDFEATLSGDGQVGNTPIQTQRRKRDLVAPMPTVGLYGGYAITPKLTVAGRVDYMSLSAGSYDGSVINTEARASYRVWRNVGVGGMYRYVSYDFDVEKKRWTGNLDYKFSGPAIFLQAIF
jgi:hypothetical protein